MQSIPYIAQAKLHTQYAHKKHNFDFFLYVSFVALHRDGLITESFCVSFLSPHFRWVNSQMMFSHWIRLGKAGKAVIGIISLKY